MHVLVVFRIVTSRNTFSDYVIKDVLMSVVLRKSPVLILLPCSLRDSSKMLQYFSNYRPEQ